MPLNASVNICGFNKSKRPAVPPELGLLKYILLLSLALWVLLDPYNAGKRCAKVYMKNK